MNKLNLLIIILLFQSSSVLFSNPERFNSYFINAAKRARSSVVSVIIYKETPPGSKKLIKVADATGTIISSSGYIVTNYHVVSKGSHYEVFSHKGEMLELKTFQRGKLYLADSKTDIALLKAVIPLSLQPITIADSDKLSAGEWVLAIGNPYGLSQTITSGIVSYKGRNNIGFAHIEDFIQTDVSLNPGNSGGPLINLHGNLVGINTAIRTMTGGYQGISFSIPSNIVAKVYKELLRYGRVRRGWLGFFVREGRYSLKSYGRYVEIKSIISNSPAAHSGLRKGDIIKSIDGKKIKSISALVNSIAEKPIGRRIKIVISRNGQLYKVPLVLREKKIYRKMRRVMKSILLRYGIEFDETHNKKHLVISYVNPRKPYRYIKTGENVTHINGYEVSSLDKVMKIYFKGKGYIRSLTIKRGTKKIRIKLIHE